jgi:arabinosaccharide transport system substrate-binding protein
MTLACVALTLQAAEPLEIWISSEQDKQYYETMVARYKATQDKDFEATVRAWGFREMPEKLAIAMKTGVGAPDLLQLDEVFFGMYLGGKVPFVDLTDRVKKDGLDKGLHPARLDLFTWQNKVYGLPQSLSAMVLYYRVDAFEELGITEADVATWPKLHETGKKLAKDGQATLALDWSYLEILMRQRGTDLFDAKGTPLPDLKKAADTMEFIKKLQDDGVALYPDRGSIFDPVFFGGDIMNREVFCVIGADWYGLDMIQQFAEGQEGEWRAAPLPIWPDSKEKRRTSVFAGQGLMIYEGSKRVDDSWKFMSWVMQDKEANAQRFLMGNSFPAWKPAWKDKRVLGEHEFFGGQRLGKLFAELGGEIPVAHKSPRRPQAVFMLRESVFASVLYGDKTALEALTELKGALSAPPGAGGGPPQ